MTSTAGADRRVVVVGAGPAGLTAAYELAKLRIPFIVVEKDGVVGGIARTVCYKGYRFDIGGHRFFTKVQAVEAVWKEVLGEDFLERKRLSRIYYDGKFFHYPLRPANALLGLGLLNSVRVVLSYFCARAFPIEDERTFEDWVTNRFGRRLYKTFFKTYTEKVWGIPCTELSSEWAAQRIKGLSLVTALKDALLGGSSGNGAVAKTLVDTFHYPRHGPGMMWQKVADEVTAGGGTLRLATSVELIRRTGDRVTAVEVERNGTRETLEATDFIASMPLTEVVRKLDPPPPPAVLEAAADLGYRDFLTVVLIVNRAELFPDNWIYVHDPSVQVGRIQNFKNWSPQMVPDPAKTCLGLEYFCFAGDGLWTRSDAELIELGKDEMQRLGLVDPAEVEDGTVVRMPKAYPVYDGKYAAAVRTIREFLERMTNLQVVGRNGMHKYNNQDHSMLTAMLAVRNVLGGGFDLWAVNDDQEYHEELGTRAARVHPDLAALAATQPLVPRPGPASADRRPDRSAPVTSRAAFDRNTGKPLPRRVSRRPRPRPSDSP